MQILEKKTYFKQSLDGWYRRGSYHISHDQALYVQCNSSASFQFIKLRNFFPKASAKIGVTTFIKSYSSNDCKSMVCVPYDIPGVLIYVKGKIVHYRFCCIARDALQKMVGLLKNMVTCKYGPKLKEVYSSWNRRTKVYN